MKVLIVNTSDIEGGAARAAYRLHKALLEQNIDSEMLSNSKSSDDFTVTAVAVSMRMKLFGKFAAMRDRLLLKKYPNKTKTLFSSNKYSSGDAVKAINSKKADIVHLHWVNHGMLTIEDLLLINAPIVWSLHDMWLFTGGCHYDEGCNKYLKQCGKCKVLKSSKFNDLSHSVYKRKYNVLSELNNFTVIGLSKWLQKSAQSSSLLKDKTIVNLPNPISTVKFKPVDKKISRELWGLPQEKKLVLFGAMGATSDPRKGFLELTKAIKKVNTVGVEFVIFGSSEPEDAPDLGCIIHYMGVLSDDISLITLYSAVDVMIVPSKQENLSNAIMESLACATPVIGFDIGGNSDLIEHKKNGYLAQAFVTADLANGIEWVLENKRYDELCFNARDKVVREFDSEIVAEKYIKLYQEVLNS
jgi:glycosyltransferase involved in cell wall biosynthesis